MQLTAWLDEFMRPLAEASGIPASELSIMFFGEGIGNLTEIIADWTTKGWFNRVVQGLVGLITCGYAIWGKGVDPRLRRELIEWGSHSASRALIINPRELPELVSSVEQSVDAALVGDVDAFINSIVRSPDEIASDIENIGNALGLSELPASPPSTPSEFSFSFEENFTAPSESVRVRT